MEIFTNDWLWWMFVAFFASSAIQLIYYWGIFSKLAFYKQKEYYQKRRPVSVVIAARNEYNNLLKNLPLILDQAYPIFEVVLVNDCSDDDSNYLLKELSEKYSNLKVVNIQENLNFFKGKKFPLSVGIKSAKYETILLTDADCIPSSDYWLDKMQSAFIGKKEIILGYGAYRAENSLLNRLIRHDTCQIAMQYLSFALAGIPYMGVGRNLAYTKTIFHTNKGFSSHYKITSGDDDLFVNMAATRSNVGIQIDPESITFSQAKKSFSSWFLQKKRHLTAGSHYKVQHKIILMVYAISQFLFYATGITLIIIFFLPQFVLPIFGIKLVSQLFIFKKVMVRLGEKNLLLSSPLFEIVLIILNPIIYLSNFFIKLNKWS